MINTERPKRASLLGGLAGEIFKLVSREATHEPCAECADDVEIRGSQACTALAWAARRGHVGVMKAILGHVADVNAVGEDGYTALYSAATVDQAGAIDALVEAGADIELKDKDGWTPLCSAAYSTGCKAMRALLHHGANAHVRNNEGNTPLHLACRTQSQDLGTAVDLLLRSGADETIVNNDGATPAHMLVSPPSWGRLCTPEELEGAELLLSRAPNDRAWRRRCWVVMLAAHASRANAAAGCVNRGISGRGSNAADGGGMGGDSEMMESIEKHAGEDESGVVVQAGSGCGIVFDGEGGGLSSLVASLIGLELDGVFRTVVGFL